MSTFHIWMKVERNVNIHLHQIYYKTYCIDSGETQHYVYTYTSWTHFNM